MNTFQLTCFLTVAETLNFARAAELLSVTQPAVTHQIRSLEKELDVKLFNRTTHFVELTQAGRLLVEDARVIVNASARAEKRLDGMRDRDAPIFSIGCHIDGCLQCLPDILREFSVICPDVHPQIYIKDALSQLFRLLEDERADAVFSIKNPEARRVGVYKELVKSPIVCVCAATHPLSSHRALTKDDLRHERLILFDTTKASFFSAALQTEMLPGHGPEDLYFCESTLTAILLAKAGYGVFFLPDVLAPNDDDLAAIPIKDTEMESFGLYYRTLQNKKLLQYFIEAAEKQFS